MELKSSKTLVDEALKKVKTLSALSVKKLFNENGCTLIDIRDIRELWEEGTIQDSVHIPRGMLEFWLDPQSPYYKKEKFSDYKKEMVLFCAAGMRSALAAKSLNDMGYKNVSHVEGGFGALKLAGLETISQKKE